MQEGYLDAKERNMTVAVTDAQYALRLKKQYNNDFRGPCSLACDTDGNFIVVEEFAHCVTKYTPDFSLVWRRGKMGKDKGCFTYPTRVVIDRNNNSYVTDRWNHRVQKIDPHGVVSPLCGEYGNGDGQFIEPWGIAFHDERMFVVDRGNARVAILDTEGMYQSHFGKCGTPPLFYEGKQFKQNFHYVHWVRGVSKVQPVESKFFEYRFEVGELEYPEDITISNDGYIYITDRVGGYVAVYDMTFSFITSLMCEEDEPSLHEPSALCAYRDGIFIGEEARSIVWWCEKKRKRKIDLGAQGVKMSGMYVQEEKNLLYICDAWNNCISVFDIEKI